MILKHFVQNYQTDYSITVIQTSKKDKLMKDARRENFTSKAAITSLLGIPLLILSLKIDNIFLFFFFLLWPITATVSLYIYYYYFNPEYKKIKFSEHKNNILAICLLLWGCPYIVGGMMYLLIILVNLLGMMTGVLLPFALQNIKGLPAECIIIDLIISFVMGLVVIAVYNKKTGYFWLGFAVPLLAYILQIPAFK